MYLRFLHVFTYLFHGEWYYFANALQMYGEMQQ